MINIIKALNETGGSGIDLVPQELANQIVQLIYPQVYCRQIFPTIPMNSLTLKVPKQSPGTTVYTYGDDGVVPDANTVFTNILLTAKKLIAMSKMSTEVIEDANVDIAQYVLNDIVKNIALSEDDAFINGDLTFATPNHPRTMFDGIRVTASAPAVAMGGVPIDVAAVNQAKSNVESSGKFIADVILIHPKDLGTLRGLADIYRAYSYGSPVIKVGEVGQLFGMSVFQSALIPSDLGIGTNETEAIVMDSRSYVIGDRRQIGLNKFYNIASDDWSLQMNERIAFAAKYPEAAALITGIIA